MIGPAPRSGASSEIERCRGDELSPQQLYALLRLRVDVFVVEQECPYPELDGNDLLSSTEHLWVRRDDEIVACLRILAEADGAMRIGRVCTAATARGTGLGAELMRAALRDAPDTEFVLDSQTYAQGFYGRFGFAAEGEPFDEDGIPHIVMRRQARHSVG